MTLPYGRNRSQTSLSSNQSGDWEDLDGTFNARQWWHQFLKNIQ